MGGVMGYMYETQYYDKQISVVISSCDKYRYLWDIQLALFQKYWATCPYDIYMISESSRLPHINTSINVINYNTNLPTSGPRDWSTSLVKLLTTLESEYIIYLQEDYVFIRNVDQHRLNKLVKFSLDNQINYVRFHTTPSGNGDIVTIDDGVSIKEILPGTRWRNSLMLALWNKKTLLTLLESNPNITPWEFELQTSTSLDKFYCINLEREGDTDILPFMGIYGSSNGFGIYPSAEEFLKQEGITLANGDPIDFNIRL